MKVFGAFLLLLFAVPARSQDCDAIVDDHAEVLKPAERVSVTDAARQLNEQGADVRVRTVGITPNLDIDEKDFEQRCASWRSPDGGRKSTLLVLMVSPQSRKAGIYIGAALKPALDAHWNRIMTDYMKPHFKTADWAGGFLAAEQQLSARIIASKDEAVHPATSTTVNQATDLSGLWTVLKWTLAFGLLIAGMVIFIAAWNRRRKAQQELREAQRKAIDVKARAAELLKSKHPRVDEASQEFSRLSASIRNDPYADDLAVEEYNAIAAQYQKVVDMLQPVYPSYFRGEHRVPPAQKKEEAHEEKHPARPSASDVAASSSASSTVITGIPVPMSYPEPVRMPEPEPERAPERHHSHHRSSSDSDSSGSSGGSSSWSSGSSDSSSSSDSGGSSDFGSSDSGSGGSSDF